MYAVWTSVQMNIETKSVSGEWEWECDYLLTYSLIYTSGGVSIALIMNPTNLVLSRAWYWLLVSSCLCPARTAGDHCCDEDIAWSSSDSEPSEGSRRPTAPFRAHSRGLRVHSTEKGNLLTQDSIYRVFDCSWWAVSHFNGTRSKSNFLTFTILDVKFNSREFKQLKEKKYCNI